MIEFILAVFLIGIVLPFAAFVVAMVACLFLGTPKE
jgi:hypothetical protein